MGEWDYYCFLCAAAFYRYDRLKAEDYNSKLLSPESLEWLQHLRLIGMNKYSTSMRRCYLSGLGSMGEAGDMGSADVTPGNDPVFPTQAHHVSDGKFIIDVYTDENGSPNGALPVHPGCLQIFVQALTDARGDATITRFEDIDFDLLFECLS